MYYSRSGHTRQLAEQIAQACGGDLEAIVDRTDRSGLLGFLRSAYQAYRRCTVEIEAAANDASAYDLVAIGTPVWDLTMSTPVRSYLVREFGRLPAVAFFCTSGGRGGERALEQMARECGVDPATTLIVREAELARSGPAIQRFARDLVEALEPVRPGDGASQRRTPPTRRVAPA